MPSEIAKSAEELEILVARAVRHGRLDIEELLDVYVRLKPGGHEHLENERRVDLDAMVGALATLPRDMLDAYEILVVPRLDRYEHEPVESGLLPAGRLADGALLIEASFSHVSLVNLVAPLCALAHEVDKAQPLLAAAGLVAVAADEPAEIELPAFEPEPEPEPKPKTEAAVEPEASGPTVADEDSGADEGDSQVAAALARIAFALGVDQTSLEAADDRTEGALLRLLLCQAEIPEVRIHAEVQPTATARRAAEHSQRILAALAEMGLVHRPTHLWIGGGVVTECLSPYVRELRQVLLTWAAENPGACGDDIERVEPAGEDLLYALAHDFLRNDHALADERKVADRTVGIQRFDTNGMPFEIVDLGRVDARVCDARLPPWRGPSPAPILVRITPDLEDTDGAGVHALVRALTNQLASVTVVLEGTALAGESGTIVLPHLMVQWAGEHALSIPNTTPLVVEDLVGFADASVQEGAVLSVSSAALLSPAHVGSLARTYGVAAIEVGAAGLLAAVAEARWSGEIPLHTDVRWALVSAAGASTGRPTVSTLSAYAAIAITTLRDILSGPRAEPEPPPPPPKKDPPLPRPGRSFMIKA